MIEEGECPQLDRFYQLLPAIIRRRDEQEGRPLRALLRVIAREAGHLEADIGRLYNNWFIETCDDWVVPYLADLAAYPLPAAEDTASKRGRLRAPRREVAKALSYRRRGGTLALLEELAWDITGWPAKAVEYDRLVASTVNVRDPRALTGFVNVRDANALRQLRGPFDTIPHRVGLRRPGTTRSSGGYRPETVALFVWRTAVRRVTHGTPKAMNKGGREAGSQFTFDPLGRDIPLYIRPDFQPGKVSGSGIDPDMGFPVPLARHHFHDLLPDGDLPAGISLDAYGEERSLAIYENWKHDPSAQPVPASRVKYMNLKAWPTTFTGNQIGVDPVRGRMVFPNDVPLGSLTVTYHYAAPAGIGAGQSGHVGLSRYSATPQAPTPQAPPVNYRVRESVPGILSLADAIAQWREADTVSSVIEITDSGTYELAGEHRSDIILKNDRRLEIRAAKGCRPAVLSASTSEKGSGPWRIIAEGAGGRLVLDGLLIAAPVVVSRGNSGAKEGENVGEVTFRACALLPGGKPDALPRDDPHWLSVEVARGVKKITFENCITGRIEIGVDRLKDDPADPAGLYDPTQLTIADSIVDARPVAGTPQTERPAWDHAIKAAAEPPVAEPPAAELDIRRSTVLGTTNVPLLKLAENTIFAGDVFVRHRQEGGMRFCYVPPKSETPRRYQCQPDLVTPGPRFPAPRKQPEADEASRKREEAEEAAREAARDSVRPRFISTYCGSPGYAMLAEHCPKAITEGADDDGEMGALHDARDFRRLASLAARVAEFVPARVECRAVLLSPGNEHELRS